MASISETGHAKNVAAFQELISICKSLGSKYDPTAAALKLPALNGLLGNAVSVIKLSKTAKTTRDTFANDREILFTPLRKMCTQLVNILEAGQASAQTVNDAKSINRKIQGGRAKAKPKEEKGASTVSEEPKPKTISVSQLSFDKVIDNYESLINIIEVEPSYAPNEPEFRLTTLRTLLTNLKDLNLKVDDASAEFVNAMISRDNVLYGTGGVCDVVSNVKKYYKGVFGAGSTHYKKVAALKFTRK